MIKPIAAAILFAATAAAAQNSYAPITPLPLGDILLSLPTSHIPTDGTWEVKFTHRFNQSIDQGSFSDRVHSLRIPGRRGQLLLCWRVVY